jgi:hypothetical protein
MLKPIARFPIIIALGAALIGWMAGEVIVTDPTWNDWVNTSVHWLHWVGPALSAVAVIVIGMLLAHKHVHVELEALQKRGLADVRANKREISMKKATLWPSVASGMHHAAKYGP